MTNRFQSTASTWVLALVAIGGLAVFAGCTEEGSSDPVDVEEDTGPEPANALSISISENDVVENDVFVIDIQARTASNSLASGHETYVSITTDRGELNIDGVQLVGGVGFVQARLNREGLATLRFSDGELPNQNVPITIVAPSWEREPSDSVLKGIAPADPEGSNWTFGGIHGPSVVADGDDWWMYFATTGDSEKPGITNDGWILGRARSPNEGRDWVFDPTVPLVLPEELETGGVSEPHVLVDSGGVWHLWYTSWPGGDAAPVIGHATSSDGITFEREPCLDLSGSSSSEWNGGGVAEPHAVELEDGSFRLFFSGLALGGATGRQIGSVSGDCASGFGIKQLVIELGANTDWDEDAVRAPYAWREGGVWKMLYRGDRGNGATAFGYATSDDGVQWERSESNPLFLANSSAGSFELQGVDSPFLIPDADQNRILFYSGYPADERARIGRATDEQ